MASAGKENSGRWCAARATDTTSNARRFQYLQETVIETQEVQWTGNDRVDVRH